MNDLMTFLSERDIAGSTKTVSISKDIPFEFTIKPLSAKKHKDIQKRCTNFRSKGATDIDTAKLQTLICLECTSVPSFADAEFLDKLGVITPEEALDKVLTAGEQAELYRLALEYSGFDRSIDEDIAEAKN